MEEGTYESQVPRAPTSYNVALLIQTNQDSCGRNLGVGGPSLLNQPHPMVMRFCPLPIPLFISKLFCLKCVFVCLSAERSFRTGKRGSE